jgi:rod shape-determining protein MreD
MALRGLIYPSIFIFISLLFLFFRMLPLDLMARNWAAPDFLICFTLVWSMRKPEAIPAILIASIFLLQDFLFQRPPGLYAALALLACEWSKRQALRAEELPFPIEWLTATMAILALFVAYRLLLSLSITSLPPLRMSLFELIATIFSYPIVVIICRYALRLRPPQSLPFGKIKRARS